MHRLLTHSVSEPELVAADKTGLEQQLLHRSTAQFVEQPHTGKQTLKSFPVEHLSAMTLSTHVTAIACAWISTSTYFLHSVAFMSELELAAADEIGLGLQQLDRCFAQLMEQPNPGQPAIHTF